MLRFVGALRIIMAATTAVAIVVQILRTLDRGWSLLNFFSFFTIESNIFAALVLLVVGFAAFGRGLHPKMAMWRGAATLYMATTGIIYIALLNGNEAAVDSTIPWVNLTLHYVMPLILTLDWILAPSFLERPYVHILVRWLAFPAGYIFYSLLRGAAIQWYPYPFLDPKHGSALSVGVTLIAMTILVSAIGMAMIWYGKRRSPSNDASFGAT